MILIDSLFLFAIECKFEKLEMQINIVLVNLF